MQALVTLRRFRNLATIVPVLFLAAACSQGDGPESIANEPATPLPPVSPGFCDPINFEVECPDPEIVNFNGGATIIVDNPDPTGINTSDRVARMQKFPDEVFGGTLLNLGEPVDFSEGESYTVKVWSPRPVTVSFKLEEQGNPAGGLTVVDDHSGSGSWQELCFDFTGQAVPPPVVALTIIFDNGTLGRADTDPDNWTFYYDDITQVESCEPTGGPGDIDPDAALYTSGVAPDLVIPDDYAERTAFGSGSVINPDYADDEIFSPALSVFSGTGYGANVAQVGFTGFPEGFLTRYESVDFKVKGMPGFIIFVKLFDDVDALRLNLTSSGYSEELDDGWFQVSIPVADFTGAAEATGIILESDDSSQMEFRMLLNDVGFSGTSGADAGIIPDAVVYASDPDVPVDLAPPAVDDLGSGSTFDFFFTGDADFNPALRVISGGDSGGDTGGDTGGGSDGDIAVNGGFETGAFDGWERFLNGGVLAIVTDNPSSGTYAANLVVPVRGPGDSAADPLIKNANLEAGNLTPGAAVTVSFDMRGTLSGAGGVVFAELFSELAGEGVSKAEILSGGPLAPTEGWETYSFTTTLGPDVSGGVTLQLKASCGQVEGCGVDAFIDNVSIVLGAGDAAVVNGARKASNVSATGDIAATNTSAANVGVIALTGYAPGFAAGFETLNFKVKGLPTSTIEVRFIEGGDTSRVYDLTTYSGSTDLGNDWYQLTIPLTDFAATIASNQGFLLGPLGAQAAPFSFLLTDIGFSGTADDGGGGEVGDNLVVNGGFETGTFDGWETFPGGGVQAIVTDNPSSGIYAANIVVPVRGPTDAGVDNFIKSSNLGAGNLTPGAPVTVSFDMRGALSGAGGVVFAELFSELSGGGTSKAEILSGAPLVPTTDWATYSFTTTLGADVSGGVSLQLKASCGPVEGCGVDVLFDNVSITTGGSVEPPPPTGDGVVIDFDGAGPFNFVDFEGGVVEVIANPDPSGINTTGQVARMQKFAGATFAGSTLPLASAIDFSAGPAFTMKVWSARPVPVTFKLEGLGEERVANHTGGSVWQELCFDFTGSTAGVPADGITFIFDNGVAGDAENDPTNWTFYFDAIEQVSGCASEPPAPVGDFPTITFDDPAVTYTLTDFGGNASVVTNDPAGGTNMVAQVLKPDTAEVWAGTTVSTLPDFAVPAIPFTASEARMTVRVYSPDAGVPVVLKVEDLSNDALFVEALATTTVANEWETLTFDFASPQPDSPPLNLANNYNKVSIFFNIGVTGAGEKTYYLDDIAFGGEGAGNLVVNGGFETGTFQGWETIPGGGTQAIVADNPSSGTYAANLTVPVRTQTDAAVDNLIKNSNLEAGNLTPGAEVNVSFDMRGTLSGAGGVVFAELFSELGGEGTSKAEILSGGPLTPTADWVTYSFNATLGPDVSGGVTLQLKTSCGPVEGCGVDVFFDNVSIVLGAGDESGGGGGGAGGGIGGGEPGGGIPEGSIVVNGGFETGTFDGWEQIEFGGGIQAIITDNPSSGTYAANLSAPVRTQADPAVDNFIKNSNLEAGNLTPGASVTVSFDMRGSLAGAGGVVFAELFSEIAGEGVSKSEILGGGPLTPTTDWANFSFNTTLGPDVGGGVTLQLKVSCGPVEGCGVDAFFDNISIVIN